MFIGQNKDYIYSFFPLFQVEIWARINAVEWGFSWTWLRWIHYTEAQKENDNKFGIWTPMFNKKKNLHWKELRNYKNYNGWFLEDAHRLLTVYIMETVIYTANWEFLNTNDQWWHYHVLPRTFLQPLPRAIIEESFKKRIWRYLWKKLKSWHRDCELQLKI